MRILCSDALRSSKHSPESRTNWQCILPTCKTFCEGRLWSSPPTKMRSNSSMLLQNRRHRKTPLGKHMKVCGVPEATRSLYVSQANLHEGGQRCKFYSGTCNLLRKMWAQYPPQLCEKPLCYSTKKKSPFSMPISIWREQRTKKVRFGSHSNEARSKLYRLKLWQRILDKQGFWNNKNPSLQQGGTFRFIKGPVHLQNLQSCTCIGCPLHVALT